MALQAVHCTVHCGSRHAVSQMPGAHVHMSFMVTAAVTDVVSVMIIACCGSDVVSDGGCKC